MKQMRMTTFTSHPEYGTFSAVEFEGQPICVSLEPYHRDNESNISCIPEGKYLCNRYHSARYPDTFEVTNVENRSKILFHKGNVKDHTQGCIILGESFGTLNGDWAVLSSGVAFREFRELTRHVDEFMLTIKRAW